MLPADQLLKLKEEIEREGKSIKRNTRLEKLLLSGPVATKRQLQVIAKNRATVNQWQKK